MEKLSNAKLRLFASLAAKKYRYRHRMFIVEGKKMYEEALHSGWPLEAVIVSGPLAGAFIPPPERMPPVPLWWAEDQDFRQLAQLVSPEGILTIVRFPEENFGTWTGEKPACRARLSA